MTWYNDWPSEKANSEKRVLTVQGEQWIYWSASLVTFLFPVGFRLESYRSVLVYFYIVPTNIHINTLTHIPFSFLYNTGWKSATFKPTGVVQSTTMLESKTTVFLKIFLDALKNLWIKRFPVGPRIQIWKSTDFLISLLQFSATTLFSLIRNIKSLRSEMIQIDH